MSLPTRRLASAAPSTLQAITRPIPRSFILPIRPATQIRSKWTLGSIFGSRRGRKAKSSDDMMGENLDDPKVRERFAESQQPKMSSSIFEEEVDDVVADAKKGGSQAQAAQASVKTPETMAWRLDPDPRARLRWERKKVIQMVHKNGHVTRDERIAQTEKKLSHKSPFLETSVKKLVHLARQIQGKSLEEAVLQMSYSKKKMAAEVKYQLEEARDLAVVTRRMGIVRSTKDFTGKERQPIKIQTKDGKSLTIPDPRRLYVAEAWVGRGPWRAKELDYKGRGRFGIMQSPSTSISVVLKEEKTRIREHTEKLAKQARRKPWVHLPDRPVTAQRPYYSW
ncbi:ribosomal protein L22/L17 [Colletotrichum phormii]|uniref:Ribosomal protein L22/L17 n=1 Tax=Colletotrichum phormii TaxID=359342 RepID=A0AAI9ZR12_9PEZI|nr:ribosomal protein L22/L17 [Colletotrichum phormii]KAK1635234.1 ribosomal protein L22/L17 [Colletotrichum phormii]